VLPEALVNCLALLGWSAPAGDGEVNDLEALSRLFSLDRVSAAPARFDPDRLMWFNRQHLRRVPLERLLAELPEGIPADREIIGRALSALRGDAATTQELIDSVLAVCREPVFSRGSHSFSPADGAVLGAVSSTLAGLALPTEAEAQEMLGRVEKKLGLDRRALMHPVRMALTGASQGPAVAALLWILGTEEARRRIDRVLALTAGA
jgi:glutamyl/glutaminyl-tRNA synthetase